jgi:uncharacterized lipoprotein YddW (UPF0748 family)
MNVYEKYLSIDEVAGGQLALRGDSDTVGFQERFYVKIQNKYKQEAHEEERKKGGALDLPSIDEKSTKWVSRLHVFQAYLKSSRTVRYTKPGAPEGPSYLRAIIKK